MTLPNDKGAGSETLPCAGLNAERTLENVSPGQHLGDDQVQPVLLYKQENGSTERRSELLTVTRQGKANGASAPNPGVLRPIVQYL